MATLTQDRVAAPARYTARRGGRPPRKRVLNGARHLILTVWALVTVFPVMLVISTALKTEKDVRVDPFSLFTSFSWENISNAWTFGKFGSYVWDSVLLTVPSTALTVVAATAAGYTFARLNFPGRTTVFYVVILGLMVPEFTYMIPLYYQLRQMGLLDTLLGATLVMATGGLAFGTFFMRSFFIELPLELEQAARVDGASEWQIFTRIMLPLVKPGIAALTVFTFLRCWNNLVVPLIYLPSGQYRPLTLGLYLISGGRSVNVGLAAAGALFTILPVIVLFVTLQRQVTQGFIGGAVKG